MDFEFEPYKKYPELIREVAFRFVKDGREVWKRRNALPLSPYTFQEMLRKYEERYGKVEVHVSTCMYTSTEFKTDDALQIEIVFEADYENVRENALVAYYIARNLEKYKPKVMFTGNKSFHVIVRKEVTDDELAKLRTVLTEVYINGRKYKLDVQMFSKCHMRRMLCSQHLKTGRRAVFVPVSKLPSIRNADDAYRWGKCT